jgi:hypothetical protein
MKKNYSLINLQANNFQRKQSRSTFSLLNDFQNDYKPNREID